MSALSLSLDAIRPLNRWDYTSIRPGPVGSMGDALLGEKLKASLPGEFRWDPMTAKSNEPYYGSNISDGMKRGYSSGGGPPRTIDSNWGGRRRFETSHGWRMQDLRPEDRRIEPTVGALPQYSWRNKIATVDNARTTGDMFPIPSGGVMQGPAGIMRGGNYPRVTAVVNAEGPVGITPSLLSFKPSSSAAGIGGASALATRQLNEGKAGTLGRVRR